MSSSRGLRVVSIGDLEVNFPFEPYDIQKDLMGKVVECIQTRSNGLLESPTGTGKTLSLLCAALAWQRKEKQSYRMMIQSADFKLSVQSSNAVKAAFEPPKIIYASRTHSQLSQAVLELKRSHYGDMKAIVLGSRDVLCIHEEVQRIPNSTAKIAACQAKVQRRICSYHNNVQLRKEDPAIKSVSVVDIEDIIKKGKQSRFCPFFMSRELVKDADIVFMPYNYILDPKIRSTHGIDLANSVIILDEGHNIPKLCEDAVSFEIRSTHIAGCISELTKAMNELKEQQEGGENGNSGLTKDLNLQSIARLKQKFLSLETELDKVEGKAQGYTLGGQRFIEILSNSGFTSQLIPRLTVDLDLVGTFLTGVNSDATACDKFGSVLRILSSNSHQKTFTDSYKVYVELEVRKDGRRDFRGLEETAKVFNFWCFNPSVGLETLSRFGPRSIILSSGTLSPISFLKEELSLPFPIQLSNPHIIQDNQLFVGVLKVGPKNVQLTSSYENREKKEYLDDLGESVAKICSLVPAGVLVFFPSYYVMDSCVRSWRESNIMASIQQFKKVLVEPRGSESFKQVLDEYYAAVRAGGGCLMAVCRGKVSEGLDFTDDYGRAVILTGIPYSPAKDPKIVAKREYLDAKARSGGSSSEVVISGAKWYQLEASRALNQAVGRIIRHAHDYGAILFCDGRCDEVNVKSNLSQWVSGRLKSYTKFSEGTKELARFFGTSLQEERKAAHANFLAHQNKFSMDVDLEKFKSKPKKNPFMRLDVTDDDLDNLYAYEPGEETLNLSRDDPFSPPRKKGTKENKTQTRSSLFEDLAAYSNQQNDAKILPPVLGYSPLFVPGLNGRKSLPSQSSAIENPKKKIRVVQPVGKFSSIESRQRLIKVAMNSKEEAQQSAAFSSAAEFWQWVKLSLSKDNYSKFIRAIKKFKNDTDAKELGAEVKTCFKGDFISPCLQGMSLFLTPEQLNEVKREITTITII